MATTDYLTYFASVNTGIAQIDSDAETEIIDFDATGCCGGDVTVNVGAGTWYEEIWKAVGGETQYTTTESLPANTAAVTINYWGQILVENTDYTIAGDVITLTSMVANNGDVFSIKFQK